MEITRFFNPLIVPVILSQAIFTQAIAKENSCLEALTNLTVVARQCRANLKIDDDCSEEIKAAKVQELICERDGYESERINKAIEIGAVIVEKDERNSPTRIWIDSYISSTLSANSEKLQDQIDHSIAPLKDQIALQGRSIDILKAQIEIIGKALDAKTPSNITNEKFNALEQQVFSNKDANKISKEVRKELNELKAQLDSINYSRRVVNDELLKLKQQVNTLLLDGSNR